ncbi:MAG: SH3 domain-containing protein [bacterium]
MKKYPLLTIVGSGIIMFFLSLAGTYYWASSSKKPQKNVQNPRLVNSSEQQTEEKEEDRVDTAELTPDNWELFLDYEGERIEMLGIKRKYNQVNLRAGPGTDYEIAATPSGGDLLFPLDRFNQWYRVQLEDGQLGWIYRSLVRQLKVPRPVVDNLTEDKPSLKEATEKLNPDEFEDHNHLIVKEKAANFRSGPGRQFSIRGRVYRYQKLRLLGRRADWYRIRNHIGANGWVNEKMVEPVFLTPPEDALTLAEEEVDENTLRSQPKFQFRGHHILPEQFPLKVIERTDEWIQVILQNGDIGWLPRQNTKSEN